MQITFYTLIYTYNLYKKISQIIKFICNNFKFALLKGKTVHRPENKQDYELHFRLGYILVQF